MWLVLLIILGWITYQLVKKSVATTSRFPVWLFWLVMMTPALIWTSWLLIYGEDKPLPLPLVIIPFVFCPLLYWGLLQISPSPKVEKTTPDETAAAENPENQPNTEKQDIRPITVSEEKSLRDCFPWGIYYLQNLDYLPQVILCRGKLKTVPEVAYHTIKENVENVFGNRFLVLFQESLQGQPFFVLIPNPHLPSPDSDQNKPVTRPVFALSLFLMTLLTTTWMGAIFTGITRDQLQNDPSLLIQGLPYALAIVTVLGIHELGHYLSAIYYKIKVTLPYFIPFPQFLGVLGAFVQLRSPIPHRRALFDVAITGPFAGLSVTFPLLYWGLSLSQVVPIDPENTSIINFQALDPRFSFLLAAVSKIALGSDFSSGQAINLHPLAIAGYVGLIVTALNLMPVGRLDGGKIAHGMFGQRTAIVIGQFARLAMFILALIRGDFIFWLWTIALFLIPLLAQPALNDVSELDNTRDLLGLMALGLLVMIVLPVPGAIEQWFHF